MSTHSSPAPVAISPRASRAYEQVPARILDQTTKQFAQLIADTPPSQASNHRCVDTNRWKPFKKFQNVEIFRSRERIHPTVFTDINDEASPGWTPVSKLLCVGTVLGTLDDVMYGATTPTELAMATRSLYIQDEFTEHHVVHDIISPTRDEPFRYLGIKYGAHSSSIAALVKPRDSLYLEASGCKDVQLHSGGSERVGYIVYHSVEIPEMVHPKAEGVVRGHVSACYIFRQAAVGIVELYGTMTSDPGGNLPSKLATLSSATIMISASKVAECAVKKKLAWMLMRQSGEHLSPLESDATPDDSPVTCMQCSRHLSGFSSLAHCMICRVQVCSRCITTRKLILGNTKFRLRRKTISACKRCISVAKNEDNAAKMAAADYAGLSRNRIRLDSATPSVEAETNSNSSRGSRVPMGSAREDTRPGVMLTPKIVEDDDVIAEDFTSESVVVFEPSVTTTTLPAQWVAQQAAPQPNEKMQWWMRINELRLQAEETYQLAKEQTIVMQRAPSR